MKRLSTRILVPLLLIGILLFLAFAITFYELYRRDEAIATSASKMSLEMKKTLELVTLSHQLKEKLRDYQKPPDHKLTSPFEPGINRIDVLSNSFKPLSTEPNEIRIYKNYKISWQRYKSQFKLALATIHSGNHDEINHRLSALSLYSKEMTANLYDLVIYTTQPLCTESA